jgi:hypothetical protein
MRFIFIIRHPDLAAQYTRILFTKKTVHYLSYKTVKVDDLVPQHDVLTDHQHHRQRVADLKNGLLISGNSSIVVVDDVIFDGHHRVAALKEAGINYVRAEVYTSDISKLFDPSLDVEDYLYHRQGPVVAREGYMYQEALSVHDRLELDNGFGSSSPDVF